MDKINFHIIIEDGELWHKIDTTTSTVIVKLYTRWCDPCGDWIRTQFKHGKVCEVHNKKNPNNR